jgi:hypothetical protein
VSAWYLWCPACDAYWTLPAMSNALLWVDQPPSLDDKRCPRCGGELKAGTAIYDRPTAPMPKGTPHLGEIVVGR